MLGIPIKKEMGKDPRARITLSFFPGRPTVRQSRWLITSYLSVLLVLWGAGSLLARTSLADAFVSFMAPLMPALSSGGPASTDFPAAARLVVGMAGAAWPIVTLSMLIANVGLRSTRVTRPSIWLFSGVLLMLAAGVLCIHVIDVFAGHEAHTRSSRSLREFARGSILGLSLIESILIVWTGFLFGAAVRWLRNYTTLRDAWLAEKSRPEL